MLRIRLAVDRTLKVLTEETIKSSAIEGVVLDPESARSSIAKRLGLDVAGLCSSLLNALSC